MHRSNAVHPALAPLAVALAVLGLMTLLASCSGKVGGTDQGGEPPPSAPCDGVTCSGHGTCQVSEGAAACSCASGFHASGLTCVADDPCAGETCSGHGTCQASGDGASCGCDAGYHANGMTCVADGTTPPSSTSVVCHRPDPSARRFEMTGTDSSVTLRMDDCNANDPALPVLSSALEPDKAGLVPPLAVCQIGAQCPRVLGLVSPAIAIPTSSRIRTLRGLWNGRILKVIDPFNPRLGLSEEPYNCNARAPSFMRPLFSLEGIPAGEGTFEVRGYDAAGAEVASVTIPGLTHVVDPPLVSLDKLRQRAHPRVLLTEARLNAARARSSGDLALKRYRDQLDRFMRALDNNSDPTSSAFKNEFYDPHSMMASLALCRHLYQGTNATLSTRCSSAAIVLAMDVVAQAEDPAPPNALYDFDTGYNLRGKFMMLVYVYDWLHDRLTREQRIAIAKVIGDWLDRYAVTGYAPVDLSVPGSWPVSNYYGPYLLGLGMAATVLAGEEGRAQSFLDRFHAKVSAEVPVLNQRVCGGDWAEGWNYGHDVEEAFGLGYVLAGDIGEDWSAAFDFLTATPRWFTYQVSPDFAQLRPFGGYSANQPSYFSPALTAILSTIGAEPGLATRIYSSCKDNDRSGPGGTFLEMLFWKAQEADLSGLPLSYAAAGTGRFISRSSLSDASAYQVTAETSVYAQDHYGYSNGDVRLYKGGTCLICPAAYRGPAFDGEAVTEAFSTYLVGGSPQSQWTSRNNQTLYTVEAETHAAIGMRFESSYARGRFDPTPFEAPPLDYLIREVVHLRPGTLVVRDLHRRAQASTSLATRWHFGSSAAVTSRDANHYEIGGLNVSVYGTVPARASGTDRDQRSTAVGTVVTETFPSTAERLETVWVFSENLTATRYQNDTVTLSDGRAVVFGQGTVSVVGP